MAELGKKGAATRQLILDAARVAFTATGYDAGVREIAEAAGVTAMLVNRYFGSKDKLFEEVIDAVLATPGIVTPDVIANRVALADLCRDLAAALVARTAPDATPLDGFLIMLRSANNPKATTILRVKFEEYFAKPLAAILPGDQAKTRAAMLLVVIAGFQLMRQVVEMADLTTGDSQKLSGLLERMFLLLAGE
ncbi:TetR/AcrR family transcriptional regulator [Cupriavidus pauculus]|uniref:TetR/AcrR family transcriptional regulator n=1 Tax=Cupriavidus pauculus TaxID=82633 RepID=UPI001EE17FA3|nr:TetR/AcrR family transcriptional regulator [Cupriavidus pauculus]GJG96721.1 TetR/AcrR family transcriptional regulator [Cupriavidus pauculus]